MNGAENTISALSKETQQTREDILEYLRDCPLYETVSIGEKDFLLVHGGLGNYKDGKSIKEYTPEELLFMRPDLHTRYSSDYTTIIGHTPTNYYLREYKGKILKTDTWIDIDTGAASGLTPSLLRLDDMAEFYL
jgi:serine/threonine protein phosphatase 1